MHKWPCGIIFVPTYLYQTLNNSVMEELKLPSDRRIDSTDTNEFANGMRDETLLAEDIYDDTATDVPLDDDIPDAVNENMEEERPLYNESGMDSNVI